MTVIRHLYVHIPFCAKVCPYCAFHVHRGGTAFQAEFVAALIEEIKTLNQAFKLDLETIYFGGGTPSLLSETLFEQLTAVLPRAVAEVTMEVNPRTVTRQKAACWKNAGVNRVSLGVQSFDPAYLKLLGRDHTPEGCLQAVQVLREAGLTNLNIDLMFALPNQPRSVWISTLTQALACQPTHVSCYGLTYEEDTPFFQSLKSGIWNRDEDEEIWMFTETEKILGEAGLPFYEISNFARPGYESEHNRAYWLGKDYLGCGPSAYSTVGGRRWKNPSNTRMYIDEVMAGRPVQEMVELLPEDLQLKERLMFGLRMREGVEAPLLAENARIRDALEGRLLIQNGSRIYLTSKGRLVADSIAELIL